MKNNSVKAIKKADQKPTLSLDSYKKLNRARGIAFKLQMQMLDSKANGLPLLWIPDVLSYISDDIQSVLKEINELGLFDSH